MPNYKPDGYHSVTPYLVVDDTAKAIDFYTRAFGATERYRLPMGDRVMHAEIQLGDSCIMLGDEHPDRGYLGPKSRGGCTASLVVYVEDVDNAFRQAVDAGAIEKEPIQDQFWGDRMGTLTDPFGHNWSLATHKEDVSEEEMGRRFQAMISKMQAPQPQLA